MACLTDSDMDSLDLRMRSSWSLYNFICPLGLSFLASVQRLLSGAPSLNQSSRTSRISDAVVLSSKSCQSGGKNMVRPEVKDRLLKRMLVMDRIDT